MVLNFMTFENIEAAVNLNKKSYKKQKMARITFPANLYKACENNNTGHPNIFLSIGYQINLKLGNNQVTVPPNFIIFDL